MKDSKSIKEFKKFRPKDYNIKKIVSDNEEVKDIYFYHERSAINTLSKQLVDYRKKKPQKIKKERASTLNKIIDIVIYIIFYKLLIYLYL